MYFRSMEALDLILLGRQLSKIGETVLRGGHQPDQPTGAGLVLRDVFAHPQSPISQITARTGLPQSYVSETVARLRERGIVESHPDPHDGRRTLVSVAPGHPATVAEAGEASVDDALRAAFGTAISPKRSAALIATLEELARLLKPAELGPIMSRIDQARGEK
jgi:DNA-binding MarR family transcriptional regulator